MSEPRSDAAAGGPNGSPATARDPSPKSELFGVLTGQYDVEVEDNRNLFSRCAFVLSAIVVVGTIAASMTNGQWIRAYLPRVDVVFLLSTMILVYGALAVSIVFLMLALSP